MVATSQYPYFQYPFAAFNPLQEKVLEYVDSPCNVLICAPTAGGKTVAAEMLAGKALSEGKKVVYLCPIKALVEDKISEWCEETHPWVRKEVLCITGDYLHVSDEDIIESDILLCTYESFAARARKAEVGCFKDVATVIVDEAHFIGGEGRGDHLENALMAFTNAYPQAKLVLISATLSNPESVCQWLTILNRKPTRVINSDYRPCLLNIHVKEYQPPRDRWVSHVGAQIDTLKELMTRHMDDQWLVFVHAKATGRAVLKELRYFFPKKKIEFHSADLEREERTSLERQFRANEVHYLIATSTLAYGVNLPARRVAVLGLKRGMEDVDPRDIMQECGRAGRPKYDREGDAYVLVDGINKARCITMLSSGFDLESLFYRNLAFHVVAEIVHGRVSDFDQLLDWCRRSLSFVQNDFRFGEETLQQLIDDLVKVQAIEVAQGKFVAKVLGKIAAYFYFSPFVVVQWAENQNLIFKRGLEEYRMTIAWMIANVYGMWTAYIPKDFRRHANHFTQLLASSILKLFCRDDSALAMGAALYFHLTGEDDGFGEAPYGKIIKRQLLTDLDRVMLAMSAISEWYLRIPKGKVFWKKVGVMFKYQLQHMQEAELAFIPGIGAVNARRLYAHGIRSAKDVIEKWSIAHTVIDRRYRKKVQQFLARMVKRKGKDGKIIIPW